MKQYQNTLKEKGLVQSMSRKGNCLIMQLLKTSLNIKKSELFYIMKFRDINQLKKTEIKSIKILQQ
jgi:putative transposase